jgi:hypothetical protein
MEIKAQKSTQFKINELVVVTKAGKIDISSMYEEINIFDSMLVSIMSGNIQSEILLVCLVNYCLMVQNQY